MLYICHRNFKASEGVFCDWMAFYDESADYIIISEHFVKSGVWLPKAAPLVLKFCTRLKRLGFIFSDFIPYILRVLL